MLGSRRQPAWLPIAGLAAAWLTAAVTVWIETRGQSFFLDDWNWIMGRRGHSVDTFLEPHNDHLSLVPVVIYKALFETAGLDSYRPYVVVLILFNLACGTLLYLLLRRHLGELVSILAAAILMTLGPAWDDILWPFQIGFLGALAAGLGALLALQRDTRRGDIAAGLLLALSLASSGGGVAFAVACFVYTVVARVRVRTRLAAIAAAAVPYGVWTLAYREEIGNYRTALNHREGVLTFDAIQDAPRLAFDYVAHVGWALTPFSANFGPAMALALIALLVYRLWSVERWPAGFWAVSAFAATHLLGTAVARTAQGVQTRYVYPSAVAALLVLAYLVNRAPAGTRARLIVVAFAVLTLLANIGDLRRADRIQVESGYVITRLAVMELARDRVAPDFKPDPARAPDIVARGYFAAIDDFGSPAVPLAELPKRGEPQRQEADVLLTQILGVRIDPAPVPRRGAGPLATGPPANVTLRPLGEGCVEARPTGPGAGLELTLGGRGVVVSTRGRVAAEVRVRRFADGYPGAPVGTVAPGSAGRLAAPPPDRSDFPWRAQVSSAEPFAVCSA